MNKWYCNQESEFVFRLQNSHQINTSSDEAGKTWHDQRGDALLLDNTDLVGIDRPKQKMIGWLTKSCPVHKEEEAWDLFCRKTFQGHSCPSYLIDICSYILRKCEGLPLAIVAISGVLATKDKCRIDEWDMICHSLGAEIHLEIGNLQSLQKLCFIEANQGCGLMMIRQLRRLGIMRLREEDGNDFSFCIEKLTSLCALSITSEGENNVIDLASLSSKIVFVRETARFTKLDNFSS